MATYNEKNEEVPDKTPVELPLGYEVPETLEQMMARMIRVYSTVAQNHGVETFEESDDFEVEGDEEMVSPYEMKQMTEEYVHEPSREKQPAEAGQSAGQPAAAAGAAPAVAQPAAAK